MSTTQCPGSTSREKEGMAGSWSKLVSTQISPRPTPIFWLSDVCSHVLAAFKNILSEIIQSWPTKNQPLHIYTSLHIHPKGALRRDKRYSTIADKDRSLTELILSECSNQVCISTCYISPQTGAASALLWTAQSCCNWRSSKQINTHDIKNLDHTALV